MIRSQIHRALLAAALALAISAASSFAERPQAPDALPFAAEAASCPDATAAETPLVPAVAPVTEVRVTLSL